MKIFYTYLLITFFLFIGNNVIQAQTTTSKPDQVKLLKQFAGNWKCKLGKDTFLISENRPFGTGMISSSHIISKNDTLDSIIQLYGYDTDADKFILSELIKSSPAVEICSMWFTSENRGEIIITNPEKAPFTFNLNSKHRIQLYKLPCRETQFSGKLRVCV